MIKIGRCFRVRRLDEKNITAEKLVPVKRKNGDIEKEWQIIGYYGWTHHAMERIVDEMLKQAVETCETLDEVLAKVNAIYKLIEKNAKGDKL